MWKLLCIIIPWHFSLATVRPHAQVEALPTLILFNKGQIIERFVGYRSADELEKEVKRVSTYARTVAFCLSCVVCTKAHYTHDTHLGTCLSIVVVECMYISICERSFYVQYVRTCVQYHCLLRHLNSVTCVINYRRYWRYRSNEDNDTIVTMEAFVCGRRANDEAEGS
jgi:hypothetical protein